VVKMETQPAKNPSFWISQTRIHYTGAKTDGFWFPQQVLSETKVRIGGTAVLTINYGRTKFRRQRQRMRNRSTGSGHSWDGVKIKLPG